MIRICCAIVLISGMVAGGCASGTRAGCCAEPSAAAPLPPGAVIHFVRLRSGLSDEDAVAMLHQRLPRFRDVPGLLQKVYGRDQETGEFCGIYIFESRESLNAFRQSELALTIREAYQVESARIERYDILMTLYPGVRGE
jgi:hypothetical protein